MFYWIFDGLNKVNEGRTKINEGLNKIDDGCTNCVEVQNHYVIDIYFLWFWANPLLSWVENFSALPHINMDSSIPI